MAIDVSIQNFRNIREARLLDENSMSIIVGLNESGKSSLIGAIQYCATGTAFGRKSGATVDGLLSRGAEKMAVRLGINNIMVTRTKSSGDTIKSVADRFGVTAEMLPLLFDSKLNGDGGCKAMRAFLDSAASSAFDAQTHFVSDPAIYDLVLKARSSGKLTTKAIIEYCTTMRSYQKEPAAPVMPTSVKPTAEQVAAAYKAGCNAQELERQATDDLSESTLLGQKLVQIAQFKQDLLTYEKQRAAASTIDPLRNDRNVLNKVVLINVKSLEAVEQILMDAKYPNRACEFRTGINHVLEAINDARVLLNTNPTPASMPTPPRLSDEAMEVVSQLTTIGDDNEPIIDEAEVRTLLNDVGLQTTDARAALLQASANARRMEAAYSDITKNLGAWESYEQAIPKWEEAKTFATAEWERWDKGAKAIAEAETVHINKSGDVFGQLVSDFSANILQGRKVRVSREEGIFLGEDNITDCSESTKWRVEAAVMAAVGVMLKSPLLLLDGADILDPINKQLVIGFLVQNIVQRFKHTIVTTTTARPIELEEAAPPGCGITKWTIQKGELKRLG